MDAIAAGGLKRGANSWGGHKLTIASPPPSDGRFRNRKNLLMTRSQFNSIFISRRQSNVLQHQHGLILWNDDRDDRDDDVVVMIIAVMTIAVMPKKMMMMMKMKY